MSKWLEEFFNLEFGSASTSLLLFGEPKFPVLKRK